MEKKTVVSEVHLLGNLATIRVDLRIVEDGTILNTHYYRTSFDLGVLQERGFEQTFNDQIRVVNETIQNELKYAPLTKAQISMIREHLEVAIRRAEN